MCVGGAVTALLSGTFPTLETTDLLQDRQAAGWSLSAINTATVAMVTGRDNTVGAGTLLDLSEGDLQTGQRVFLVLDRLSVVPLLVLQSCWITEVTGRRLGGGGRRSLRLRLGRQVGGWYLSLGWQTGHHRL